MRKLEMHSLAQRVSALGKINAIVDVLPDADHLFGAHGIRILTPPSPR